MEACVINTLPLIFSVLIFRAYLPSARHLEACLNPWEGLHTNGIQKELGYLTLLVRLTMMVPSMAVGVTVMGGPNSQAGVGGTVTVVSIDSVTLSATQLYTQQVWRLIPSFRLPA
jgi:hypothetical protein